LKASREDLNTQAYAKNELDKANSKESDIYLKDSEESLVGK
jgi:hypothetical protein